MQDEAVFSKGLYVILVCLGLVFLLSILLIQQLFIKAPEDFQSARYFTIERGLSIDETGIFLKQNRIINSPFFFKILVPVFGKTDKIIAGEYRFDDPINLLDVIKSVTDIGYKGRAIKVTIPEGFTNKDISELLEKKFSNFDKENFLKLALSKEGSLFPDTYIFPIFYTEEKIINKMFDNFQIKISDIKSAIIASKRTREQIIIMASILEKEARTTETRKKIAGILWKRLDAGKLLQVDASFLYLLNKQSKDLTGTDLNINSPYNTYVYKGLPFGAISNPGLDALTDALYPEESKYWFYLSDDEGNMHYGVTFDDHKKNKVLYLTR